MCQSAMNSEETTSTIFSEEDLPTVDSWPHRPVFVHAHRGTTVPAHDVDAPLPLGVPVEFESSLFKGRMMIRLRNMVEKSGNPTGNKAYFAGRKRVTQFIVQGQFKERLKMSEVYTGNQYERPLKRVPPKQIDKMFRALMGRIAPGLILELSSKKPQVLALQASAAMSLNVKKPGEEPDIVSMVIPEDTKALGRTFKSSTERQKYFSKTKNAEKYTFDTEHVYTFDNYQDVIDYGTYQVHMPLRMKIDLAAAMNGQPLSYTARTKEGRFLYDFPVWHERLLTLAK